LRDKDAALAADLEALLEEHQQLSSEGFLTGEAPPPARSSMVGLQVGAYTLRSQVGQGGMGSVWLADRSDGRFEGRAAVKLLNASLVGREGEARFRREGNLLARLRHPHIAHLVDAGMSPLGQPYLVLEHVDGERIDAHCDAVELSIEARIRLFLDVLTAVAFAHANLIVHRDLKPPNILVAREGQVKLLDFGIAKLIETEGDPSTALTRDGDGPLTLQYAAPEQLTGGTVTTATDVYALGTVLYLLVTGQHPARLDDAGSRAEWIKTIVDTQAPRPSDAVVSTSVLPAATLLKNAALRGCTPKKLRHQLEGDLDNIIARALKKQPGERYPSVQSMADDLRRHLNDEPVSARPDSLVYRAVKFARRNRGGVAAAGLVTAAVLAGLVGVAWQAREAGRQRDAARTQLARATAANEFSTFLLSVAAPSGKNFTVSELLDQGEALVDKQFAHDDALRAEMLATLGQQFMLSERWDRATPILERADEIAARTADPTLQARTGCPLALLKILNGDRAGAEALMQRALANLPEGPATMLQRGECLTRFAEFGFFTDDGEQMTATATRALELIDAAPFATAPKRIDAQGAQAYGYYLSRRNREADAAYAQIMRALEEAGRERTVVAADTLNNWALVHFRGDIGKSEPLLRRVLDLRESIEGAESVAPTFSHNYAGVLLRLGRYDEAEALFEATIRSAAARQEGRIELDAMMELAELYIERGDRAAATAQLARLEPFLTGPRFTAFRRAQLSYYRGCLFRLDGDQTEARAQFSQAVEGFASTEAKLAMNVLASIGLAEADLALGEIVEAKGSIARALELAESFVEPGSPSYLVGLCLVARGDAESLGGETASAHASFQSGAEHLVRSLGPDHRDAKDALRKAG
jgi:serine/threonine-protein kinase